MGFRLYSLATIKKQMTDKQNSISSMVKNIQTKIFKFLFNYEAANTEMFSKDASEEEK